MRILYDLLRVNHWFKNALVFGGMVLALWYKGDYSLNSRFLLQVIGSFILASFVSSSNYIINQIVDTHFDLLHPIKKLRPIPSGKIKKGHAFILAMVIFLLAIIVSSSLYEVSFSYTLIIFFVAGIIYNIRPIRLKDVVYLDVVSESVNNPIRFSLGWFLVLPNTMPPVLLLLTTWALGAIFMTGKRYDEFQTLGKKLVPYRKSFQHYNPENLKRMVYFYSVTTSSLFIAICFKYNKLLLLCVPSVMLFLVWSVRKILSGEAKAATIESFFLTRKFIIFAIIVSIPFLIVFYLI